MWVFDDVISSLDLMATFMQLAQAATEAPPEKPASPSMWPMAVAFLVMMYFMIIAPQRKEQKKREEALNALSKGNEVVTNGGLYGKIESIDQASGTVKLIVAPKLTVKVSKSSVQVLPPKVENQGKEEKK